MDRFAARFRVIAPDTRGHGGTLHPGGSPITYAQLAEDVVALSQALGLDRPMICGFSDGGLIATQVAIRHPGAVRAVVNDAGFDYLNPQAKSFAMARQIFGGHPQATKANPEATEGFFAANEPDFLRRLRDDHRAPERPDGWKTVLAQMYDRMIAPPGITVEDLRAITAPTLILTGDRDFLCSAEEAVAAYRTLRAGELAILPGVGHHLSELAVAVTIDFLRRQESRKAA
jgi:pimeloyl-ACP methyl ester carboxylesterase